MPARVLIAERIEAADLNLPTSPPQQGSVGDDGISRAAIEAALRRAGGVIARPPPNWD